MKTLVFNAGSSSLKYKLFDHNLAEITRGQIAVGGVALTKAARQVINELIDSELISAEETDLVIGHRVVHGGDVFYEPTRITARTLTQLARLNPLAPLHNPPALEVIRTCLRTLPRARHVAVFDTAFHRHIPEEAALYGLPLELQHKYHIKKYGFHGISHQYVTQEVAQLLGDAGKQARIISCHLGNGSSIAAIRNKHSIDTSMGFSPLDGVIMGTRSGSVDPGVIFYLLKQRGVDLAQLEDLFYRHAGLRGITGFDSAVSKLHIAAQQGNSRAQLGLAMLIGRVTQIIGGYLALLDGAEAIAFTAGIGQNAWYVRELVLAHFAFAGITIHTTKNKGWTERRGNIEISAPSSTTRIFVIEANEELQIARDIAQHRIAS